MASHRLVALSVVSVEMLLSAAPREREVWQPRSAATDTPLRPFPCRIVSYADDMSRQPWAYGANCFRHATTPVTKHKPPFKIAQGRDVDGDGQTSDDYVEYLEFSLTEPLSAPKWPGSAMFPERFNAAFYGGSTVYVSDSKPGGRGGFGEIGINPDHSPPFWDLRAEDHPLNGLRDFKSPTSFHQHYWCFLWKKTDFLCGADRARVTFDDSSRLACHIARRYWWGYDDLRFVVMDGDRLYISERDFDLPTRRGLRIGFNSKVFMVRPTQTKWARYSPKGYAIEFDASAATFGSREFKDVQAVGWYLAKNNRTHETSHVKWYGFEADAIAHRLDRPSEHVAMTEVSAASVPAFCVSVCEVPYSLWKRVYRYGNSPIHTLEARYVYRKSGDMGSMRFGHRPHEQDEPVTNIAFYDAVAFCNTLSEMERRTPCYYTDPGCTNVFRFEELATRAITRPVKERNTGKNPIYHELPLPKLYVKWGADGYRLPTVAEWAAAYQRPEGNGWVRANSGGGTHAVGTQSPNKLGLHDVLGNVWELCWSQGDAFDPDTADELVVMGGGFNYPLDPMSKEASASRYGDDPFTGNHNIGIRIVRREAGAPKPPIREVVASDTEPPTWVIKKGRRTGAKPVEGPVLDMLQLSEGSFRRSPDRAEISVSRFWIDKHPLTYAKWKDVCHWADANGYEIGTEGDMGSMYWFAHAHSPDEPVTNMTWHDALVWCNALSEMEGRTPVYYTDRERKAVYRRAFMQRAIKIPGWEYANGNRLKETLKGWETTNEKYRQYGQYTHVGYYMEPWLFARWDANGYRLPTHAEFEYALRAGTQTDYFWGDDPKQKGEYVWDMTNAGGRTHPVGQKRPNRFGLHDMAGNVYQWCWSMDGKRIRTRPYLQDVRNPKWSRYWGLGLPFKQFAPKSGVYLMGCSWWYGECSLNGQHGVASSRKGITPLAYYPDVGFRVVRCEAGTHPRDGHEEIPEKEWPVLVECSADQYNPLEGSVFRGSLHRDGVFETAGVAELKGVKWKLDTGGAVRSSPVAVDGVVYVGSRGGHFHAVEAASGTELWKVKVKGGADSSACVAKGGAYFNGNDGQLYAVDAKSGQLRWRFRPKRSHGEPARSSPAVAYGTVFCTVVNALVGVDAGTGKEVWRYNPENTPGQEGSAPGGRSSVSIVGDRLYCSGHTTWGYHKAIDIRTSLRQWATGPSHPGLYNAPALVDGIMYATTSKGVDAMAMETGELKWRAILDGQVGTNSFKTNTSPTVWNGLVFVGMDKGSFHALDAARGKPVWQTVIGSAIQSSPALAAKSGLLYFGANDGCVYALEARGGKERWRLETGGKVMSSPWPTDGVLYVGSDDGHVYALEDGGQHD